MGGAESNGGGKETLITEKARQIYKLNRFTWGRKPRNRGSVPALSVKTASRRDEAQYSIQHREKDEGERKQSNTRRG